MKKITFKQARNYLSRFALDEYQLVEYIQQNAEWKKIEKEGRGLQGRFQIGKIGYCNSVRNKDNYFYISDWSTKDKKYTTSSQEQGEIK
jgi:hypothetical protein